jgi:hypothetical protein
MHKRLLKSRTNKGDGNPVIIPAFVPTLPVEVLEFVSAPKPVEPSK